MTISSTTNRMPNYVGTSLVSTYSYTFRIFDEGDLLLTVKDTTDAETTLVLTTDYTVSGVGDLGGGSITLVNGSQAWLTSGFLTTGYELSIRRLVDLVQATDIRNQGSFFPETHENAFDYLTMIDQGQQDEIGRSIKAPESDDTAIGDLPPAASRASQYLAFDANGDPIAVTALSDTLSATAFIQTFLDDADAATARTTLGALSSANGAVATANLDQLIFQGLSAVAPAVGDYVAISDVSDSGNKKKALVSGLKYKSYRSVTTTDSPTLEDDYLRLNGASFTVTLPSAVGCAGKIYSFRHAGTAFTNVYTIAGTIDSLTNILMYVTGETLQIISDGSNWATLSRGTTTKWLTYTPTFTGFGTASNIECWTRRVGNDLEIRGLFQSGIATAVEARMSLPISSDDSSLIQELMVAGYVATSEQTAGSYFVLMEPSVSYVTFGKGTAATSGLTKMNGSTTWGNGDVITFKASIPALGWRLT